MSDATSETPAPQARPTSSIINFLSERKISSAMWLMRWYTFFVALQYVFYGSAMNLGQYFQRALFANAIICALRLHQRVPEFRFSRQHLALLLQEDSAHYLLFSMIFVSSHPITLALVPISMFALLHACNFTRQILDVYGPNSSAFIRKLINYVAVHQTTLFRFVALNEIMLMPTVVFMLIMGRSSLLTPFMYYKFLHFRYSSKRNPYSRVIFYELRIVLERTSQNPKCPGFVGTIIHKVIATCCRFAPPVQVQQQ